MQLYPKAYRCPAPNSRSRLTKIYVQEKKGPCSVLARSFSDGPLFRPVLKAQNNLSYYIHRSKQRNTINFVKEGIKKEKAASFTQTS